MSDMVAAVSMLSLGECVHSLLCYKRQADPRTIGEVTEKVGTDHYKEEFLNNLGALMEKATWKITNELPILKAVL